MGDVRMDAAAVTVSRVRVSAVVRRAALLYAGWVLALFVLAGLLGLVGAGDGLRDRVGDPGLRSTPAGVGTIVEILTRNLSVAPVPLIAAYVVPRRPERRGAADVFTVTMAALSLVAGSAFLAAYQSELVVYAIGFGPIEIAGFALAIGTYRSMRRSASRSWSDLGPVIAATVAVLATAAVLEALLGGAL